MDQQSTNPSLNARKGPVSTESFISLSIIVALIIIGISILLQQYRFDERYFNASVMQAGLGGAGKESASQDMGSLKIDAESPVGYSPMSDQEDFDHVSLSDKIDGKADGYLQAGFVMLATRRFVKDSDQDQWFEFYLYDMGSPRNAFSVYSSQKREGVTPQDFTEFAYSTENALFFACGRFYIEIISATRDTKIIEDMIAMSKDFIVRQPADNAELPELEFLPAEDLDRGSISLLAKNGFGYDRFDNIITATYLVDGKKIMSFISIRETPQNAEELSKGYDDTLSEFIGNERLKPETDRIPGLVIADVFGEYEMFFTKGNIIAGIHSASDKNLGEEIAVSLFNKISREDK
ncbi:MAG: hypothetical protein JW944_09895 [Deltaproteobacteria bacterium]|nr:hypothetical protein [Deltaproteobacteria bacterium]